MLTMVQANVLIDETSCARITDFGLAVFLNSTTTATTSSFGGSTLWMAPELLYPERYMEELGSASNGQPTKQSDMYALAITIWEVRSPRSFARMELDQSLDFQWRASVPRIQSLQAADGYHSWEEASTLSSLPCAGPERCLVVEDGLLVGSVTWCTSCFWPFCAHSICSSSCR
jgi:serine/threonine protein kinase